MYLWVFYCALLLVIKEAAPTPLSRWRSPRLCRSELDITLSRHPHTPPCILANHHSLTFLTSPPFALLVLADVSTETLNFVLQEAHDNPSVELWWWYLASPDYRLAPHFRPDPPPEEGTEAPIDPHWSSEFLGMGLEEVAQWLKRMPSSVTLEKRYFGVVDKQTARTGKVSSSGALPCEGPWSHELGDMTSGIKVVRGRKRLI